MKLEFNLKINRGSLWIGWVEFAYSFSFNFFFLFLFLFLWCLVAEKITRLLDLCDYMRYEAPIHI